VAVACRFLQRVLNVLNRGGRDYADLVVDGVAGPASATALKAFLRLRGAAGRDVLLAYLNALQGHRYVELAEARAVNEKYVYGWGRRILPAEPIATRIAA
jgi:lysozyme family protein